MSTRITTNIVFLGGARRVTLAEQIQTIGHAWNIQPVFYSIEKDEKFYPIASHATILAGPKFQTQAFDSLLESLYGKDGRPTLFIACMDAAIPALARLATQHDTIVASSLAGAEIALDKELTAQFCQKYGVTHPTCFGVNDHSTKRVIAKPKQGFGSKGIFIFETLADVTDDLFATHVIQEYIEGPETTHDVYIARDGTFHIASRDRMAVIDGEVDHCIVRQPQAAERELIEKIVQSGLFSGPITIQTMGKDNICYLIEINARLGGGVTAAIEAGFPAIELLISETFGIATRHREFRSLEMKRARRDFYRFLA